MANPPAAPGPGQARRIGFLTVGRPGGPNVTAFERTLTGLGYTLGSDLTIDYRYATPWTQPYAPIAAALVDLPVEILVASGTPAAQAAKAATNDIPIVMTFSGAPVQTGLVESFARPGGNVTGVTSLGSQLSKRRLELLTQILPAVSRVAILWNPSNPDSTLEFAEACAAAQEMGLLRQSLPVQTPDNIDSAFAAAVAEGSDAMLVLGGDDLIFERRRQVTSLATANGLPSMYESRRFVDDGGLMAYGPSFPELYSSAAVYVDEILKGAPAADLPVKQPTCLRLALNLQTAGDLSLDIAPSAIVQADDVVR